MDFRYTRHQVPRGARADAESGNALYLIKSVTSLRLTYQIRLLAFRAMESKMVLIIKVPKHCDIHPSLRAYLKEFPKLVRMERF
jgi:hypothetical protein